MNENGSVLKIENLEAFYIQSKNVLDGISLDIAKGELFGLAGVNGAGKTTLIKTILGLRHIQTGQIELFGKAAAHPDIRPNIAYLPERFEPPWFLTGREFLAFSHKLYGGAPSPSDINGWAVAIGLDIVALDQKVQTYSKGMRQKLGLLGTLTTSAQFFILDEPMSGLDPLARLQVKDFMTNMQKTHGKTILMCSHILADMEEICDRIALLHHAQIQYCGKPSSFVQAQNASNLERAFLSVINETRAA